MNTGIVSVRYARALLEYCKEQHIQDEMYACMQQLLKTIMQVDKFTDVLLNPSLTDEEKVGLLCDAVPDAPVQFARFARLVVKQGRESFLRYIAHTYLSLYRKDAGILPVKVTTAVLIDAELSQRVAQLMKEHAAVILSGSEPMLAARRGKRQISRDPSVATLCQDDKVAENHSGRDVSVDSNLILEIENFVDPSIIGGFLLEANSIRLDASIKSALDKIEKKIVDNSRRLV